MPHLRALNGDLIPHATPLEAVLIAGEPGQAPAVGVGAPLDPPAGRTSDDVGLGLDPAAALEAARADAEGLAGAARAAKGEDRKRLEAAAKAAKDALEPNRGKLDEAKAALERIRKG